MELPLHLPGLKKSLSGWPEQQLILARAETGVRHAASIASLDAQLDQLRNIARAGLAHDVEAMHIDRLFADAEIESDGFAVLALHDPVKNLALSRRQFAEALRSLLAGLLKA
jgi:hypothetical protein